jgi:hypothetical protein
MATALGGPKEVVCADTLTAQGGGKLQKATSTLIWSQHWTPSSTEWVCSARPELQKATSTQTLIALEAQLKDLCTTLAAAPQGVIPHTSAM